MTGAQQASRDKAENDKGVPAHLTLWALLFIFYLIISNVMLIELNKWKAILQDR